MRKFELKMERGFVEFPTGVDIVVKGDAIKVRDLVTKFQTGVVTPEMMYRDLIDSEYEEDVLNSENSEFVDITDVEEHLKSVNDRLNKKRADGDEAKERNEAKERSEAQRKSEMKVTEVGAADQSRTKSAKSSGDEPEKSTTIT